MVHGCARTPHTYFSASGRLNDCCLLALTLTLTLTHAVRYPYVITYHKMVYRIVKIVLGWE